MPDTASLSTGKRIAIIAPSTLTLRESTGTFIDSLLAARHSLLILTDAEHAPVDNEFRAGGAVVTAVARRPEGFSIWPARQDVQALAMPCSPVAQRCYRARYRRPSRREWRASLPCSMMRAPVKCRSR
jgi:hypothetical protein